ncbi:hypothetical protein OSTOST_15886 [Ostertagia ostertagi]
MAKSKVSDNKHPTTMPKMEMNALSDWSKIDLNTLLSLKNSISIKKIMFLADSKIVLKWPYSNHHKTVPYVSNRVREVHNIVQSLTHMAGKVEFGSIETKWNPADIGTRGASAQEILSHSFKGIEGEEETECVSPVYAIRLLMKGRVEDIYDLTREVEVTNNKKTLRRPLNQLIPLEIKDSDEKPRQEQFRAHLENNGVANFCRCIWKEIEFLGNLKRQIIGNEITEAQLQEENEEHKKAFDDIKEMIMETREYLEEKHANLQHEINN